MNRLAWLVSMLAAALFGLPRPAAAQFAAPSEARFATWDEAASRPAGGWALANYDDPFPAPPRNADTAWSALAASEPDWHWQLLPDGLIYPAYLAGVKESRLGIQWHYEQQQHWLWDVSLGGHVGLLRYGSSDVLRPEGWQIDAEGAAFPRLDPEANMDVVSVDFRFGFPVTYGVGPWRWKAAYYHLSSHLGDELILHSGYTTRFNYSRDVAVLGAAYDLSDDWRLYAETGWAFASDVAEPWEFQFGVEYSPAFPSGGFGAPFLAVNGQLREELDFSGNLVVQTGWQWRGQTGHRLRAGVHYYNGLSPQFSFFNRFEEQLGFGVWYDH